MEKLSPPLAESVSRRGRVPIVVESGLLPKHVVRFQKQFVDPGRSELELLWRRTQGKETRAYYDTSDPDPKRRRMVHALDQYDVVEGEYGIQFAVSGPYIWFQTVSPSDETDLYHQQLIHALHKGNWSQEEGNGTKTPFGTFRLDDLVLKYAIKDEDIEDIIAERRFPPGYNIIEVEMAGGETKSDEKKRNPWGILRSGMRIKDVRGNPEIVTNLKQIERYFPMQVEMGCGPSTEAGIPALHYLHHLYRTQDSKGKFYFGPERDDFLSEVVADPENFYAKAAILYSKALTAEPTPFYLLLQELKDRGVVVGPVITNNFDGLCSQLGLEEMYVRRFEESDVVPTVNFDPSAKSLLVVGAHADRRKVEKQARDNGLKVIYVDPEGYLDNKGNFNPYPLESPQDSDSLIRMTSQEFTDAWRATFS